MIAVELPAAEAAGSSIRRAPRLLTKIEDDASITVESRQSTVSV